MDMLHKNHGKGAKHICECIDDHFFQRWSVAFVATTRTFL